MYTGTLIRDLLATVERAEHKAWQKQLADDREFQTLLMSHISRLQNEPVFVGAA
jgi:hypothetical protein